MNSEEQKLTENARDFFEDIAKWTSREAIKFSGDVFRTSRYKKYEHIIIKLIKKATKHGDSRYKKS